MQKKLLISFLLFVFFVMPAISQAAFFTPVVMPSITQLGENILSATWKVFAIVAVVCFVFAGIMFLTSGGQPEKIKLARHAFIYGVVGIVVAILAFSVIVLIENALNPPNPIVP
jgi:hypothetical protein